MPSTSPFTIETPSNGVRLDAKNTANVRFTVFNSSGRAQRAQASVVTEPPEAREWIAVDGATARDYPVAGTETYAVSIAVPAVAQPGSYTFRLDVQGEDDPDRSHVQGPSVTFEVPEPAVPTPRRFPWWIAAAVAAVVVVAGYFLLRPPRAVVMPDVIGTQVADGASQLLGAGLAITQPLTKRFNTSVPALEIIATTPAAGASVERGSAVEIVYSVGDPPCRPFPLCLTVQDPVGSDLLNQANRAMHFEQLPGDDFELHLDLDALRNLQRESSP